MKKTRILIQIFIGLIIIILILNRLNINEVIAVLKETDPLLFIIACISYLGMNIILATRLRYLLKSIGYRIKFSAVFLSHMGGMIVGDITPGRGGYFLTPTILKKTAGSSITDGMACIFAPQGIEFILKVIGAIAALIYISTRTPLSENLLISVSAGVVLLLAVGIAMLLISWHNESATFRFISRLPFFNRFTENLSFFKEKSGRIKESINVILALYFIGWLFAALQWYFLGNALGIKLSFISFFLLHPLITILMFVPISPAGLGLMEGGIILVFSLFGISSPLALAFSVLVRISILVVDLLGLKMVISSLRHLDV